MLLVKIENDKYESGTGKVYSYQEVYDAIYRQLNRGFKNKNMCTEVVCVQFNYDTFEISFFDKYYIVMGEYTSKKFINKDSAEKWKNRMEKQTGTQFRLHEVTQKNFNNLK